MLTPTDQFQAALALHQSNRLSEAESLYRQLLAQNPTHPGALHFLGLILAPHNPAEAYSLMRQSLSLHPNPAFYANFGILCRNLKKCDEAIDAYQKSIQLQPLAAATHNNLGNVLADIGDLDGAMNAFRRALELDPHHPNTRINLAKTLVLAHEWDAAFAEYRKELAERPDASEHSDLCLHLHYAPNQTPADILLELRRWNEQYAAPLKSQINPHTNTKDAHRKLRVGFVSPDLRNGAIARFLLPLLQCHDPAAFEATLYSSTTNPDETTPQLRAAADQWHDISNLSDPAAAALIRSHHIDLLFDLSMHTTLNRLPLFARKPAPIQITWLAYPGSTGLEAIDYRFTDPYLDPPDTDLSAYSEKTIHLLHTFWCYSPYPDSPPINPLPMLRPENAGRITFGCLNNPNKISNDTLHLWARLLNQLPASQLLLHAQPGGQQQRITRLLASHDIPKSRCLFFTKSSRNEYLNAYLNIDIALDPFPCGGGTTTCDALWMGIPVITLRGSTAVGRSGSSILSNLNLPDLISQTPDQYLEIAITLAHNIPHLADLRATLRSRMQASPLMNAPLFANNFQSACRQIWQHYCIESSRP